MHTCNPSTPEVRSGVQGHSLLHRKLDFSLRYPKLCLRKQKTETSKRRAQAHWRRDPSCEILSFAPRGSVELPNPSRQAFDKGKCIQCLLSVGGVQANCYFSSLLQQDTPQKLLLKKKKGLFWLRSVVERKLCEAAGHMAPADGRQRNGCCCSARFRQSVEWCHSHFGWVFPLALIQPSHALTDVLIEVCALGDSTSCGQSM